MQIDCTDLIFEYNKKLCGVWGNKSVRFIEIFELIVEISIQWIKHKNVYLSEVQYRVYFSILYWKYSLD